jgi:hypothetical protein
VNVRFALIHNDVHSKILGVGPAVEAPSFIFKERARSDNVGFNMEAGFFAGLVAMDKRVEFRHIPHTYMTINERPMHFIGEPNQRYSEVVIEGDLNDDKFIVYYIFGEEVVGLLTFGYQNMHLYLWEAMKLLIMPTGVQLRSRMVTHKQIIAKVLKCRPEIEAKRKGIIKTPSIIRAEFTREREELDEFRTKLRTNI